MRVMDKAKPLLVDGDMSETLISEVLPLLQVYGFSIQAIYTGSALTGKLSLEGSVNHVQDNLGNVTTEGTWKQIANTEVTLSGAGNYIWNIPDAMYPYVRVKYVTAALDSGELQVFAWVRSF